MKKRLANNANNHKHNEICFTKDRTCAFNMQHTFPLDFDLVCFAFAFAVASCSSVWFGSIRIELMSMQIMRL